MDLRSLKKGDKVEIVRNKDLIIDALLRGLLGEAEVVQVGTTFFKVERTDHSRSGVTFTYDGISQYRHLRIARILKPYPPIPCNYKVYK